MGDFFAVETVASHTTSESVDNEITDYLKSGVKMNALDKIPHDEENLSFESIIQHHLSACDFSALQVSSRRNQLSDMCSDCVTITTLPRSKTSKLDRTLVE